jgi:hypothetical protein
LPEGSTTVTGDLDGDGRADRATVRYTDDNEVELTISPTRATGVFVRNISYTLEQPSLSRTAAGSLQLHTSHMGIGRSAFEQILTIAWRQGAWRVVGLTRNTWDKLELEAASSCDINFSTGRAILTGPGRQPRRIVRLRVAPVELRLWRDGAQGLPAACGFG